MDLTFKRSTGWRDYMEDFHFALPTLGGEWSDTAAFAVLDGHGGGVKSEKKKSVPFQRTIHKQSNLYVCMYIKLTMI